MHVTTKQCLLGAAILFAGVSYILYIPLPDGLDEQWKVRIILVQFRLINIVAQFGQIVGLNSQNTRKNLFDFMMMNNKPPDMEGIKTEDYTFDGIPVRFYRPLSAKTPTPGVIYFHGGGWTVCNIDTHDEAVAEFSARSGYIFVSVEYRLAPENPFPIPFEDSYKATLYLLKHAAEFGVDSQRIAVAGDSAGGNLAAAVALKLSEVHDVAKLRFQWLIYPALQAFTFKLPSYITNEDAAPYFLQGVHMAVFWCNYIGIEATPDVIKTFLEDKHTSQTLKQSVYAKYLDFKQLPSEYQNAVIEQAPRDSSDEELSEQIQDIILNPFFSPLMKSNLSSVPPAFVVTTEYDVLRDDGLLYAERMRKDGVEVEVHNAPGSIHGYMTWNNRGWPRFKHYDVTIELFVKYAKKQFQ